MCHDVGCITDEWHGTCHLIQRINRNSKMRVSNGEQRRGRKTRAKRNAGCNVCAGYIVHVHAHVPPPRGGAAAICTHVQAGIAAACVPPPPRPAHAAHTADGPWLRIGLSSSNPRRRRRFGVRQAHRRCRVALIGHPAAEKSPS